MDLSQFITETLIAIHSGVRGANDKLGESHSGEKFAVYMVDATRDDKTKGKIEFDVAVVAGSESKQGGHAGVRVWGIGAGLKEDTSKAIEHTSRVKFVVSVWNRIG